MSTERNNLNELEARLASLTPAASRGDRDRTMYLAGFAAAEAEAAQQRLPRRSGGWLWPMSTAAMALIALSLGALLVHERQAMTASPSAPGTASPYVVSPRHGEDGGGDAPQPDNGAVPTDVADNGAARSHSDAWYPKLREQVLVEGVDALPSIRTGGGREKNVWTPRSHPEFAEIFEG